MLFSKLILARSIMDCSTKNKTLKPTLKTTLLVYLRSEEHTSSTNSETRAARCCPLQSLGHSLNTGWV